MTKKAAEDTRVAYENLASNILLVRRTQLSSPELYWISFYSENKVLGTTSALLNMHVNKKEFIWPLVLYLNSILVLIQLIAFVAETRGAWVTLHGNQVWSHVHLPKMDCICKYIKKAQNLFEKIKKLDVRPLFERVKSHDPIQREIDELALEMLGLNHWKPRLDEIYNAVAKELETMHKILETSRKKPKRTKIQQKEEKEKGRTESLAKWFKK